MENAVKEVKAASDYVTDSNEEEGAAKAIENLFCNILAIPLQIGHNSNIGVVAESVCLVQRRVKSNENMKGV